MNKIKNLIFIAFLCYPFFGSAQGGSIVSGKSGMAATAHPLATEAAIEILKNGGNAIDAAVGAAFAIGVVEPDGSGIGGGGGMVVFLNKTQTSYFINYYAKSPKILPDSFDRKEDRHSGKSVCVPGTVAGLTLAHEKFGRLPLEDVLQPAIRLAEQGFPIDATLFSLILDNAETLAKDSATAKIFLTDGFPKMEGDLIVQKELAKLLSAIGKNGSEAFYSGKFAQSMVDGIRERGGTLSLSDLLSYHATLETPQKGTYRDFEILSARAPQSGISIIEGLNILENADLKAMGHFTENPQTLHLIAETFRKVYTDRNKFIGDPEYYQVPEFGLTSKLFARDRFNAIDPYRPEPPNYRDTEAGNPYKFEEGKYKRLELRERKRWKRKSKKKQKEAAEVLLQDLEYEGSTTHLSVTDHEGNAVSLTQTLGTFFGSAQTVNGVLFNCTLPNFSSSNDSPNSMLGNKKPRTTIAPTIILKNGQPYLVIGTPGGTRIIATLIQVLVNVLDFDMNVGEANDASRFFVQKFDDYLHLESGIGQDIIAQLFDMGHTVRVHEGADLFFGGVQMILYDPQSGSYYGSADKRRGGNVIGY